MEWGRWADSYTLPQDRQKARGRSAPTANGGARRPPRERRPDQAPWLRRRPPPPESSPPPPSPALQALPAAHVPDRPLVHAVCRGAVDVGQ